MGTTKVEPDPRVPETCGFEPGTSDHHLIFQPPSNPNAGGYYARYLTWRCACDYVVSGRMVKTGKAGKSALRYWRLHLEAQIAPHDEILALGIVKRQRVQYEVYVFSRSYTGADEFIENTHNKNWNKPTASQWEQTFHYAVGLRRLNKAGDKVLGCSLHSFSRTRPQAIAKANDYITKAQEDGAEIINGDEVALTPPPMKQEASFATLLTRVDEALDADDLVEVEAMLSEVNDFLALAPILQARQQDLLTRRAMVVGRMLNEPQTA